MLTVKHTLNAMKKLWADKNETLLKKNVRPRDAWCDRCCDTAALLTKKGEWRCGSCGGNVVPEPENEPQGV